MSEPRWHLAEQLAYLAEKFRGRLPGVQPTDQRPADSCPGDCGPDCTDEPDDRAHEVVELPAAGTVDVISVDGTAMALPVPLLTPDNDERPLRVRVYADTVRRLSELLDQATPTSSSHGVQQATVVLNLAVQAVRAAADLTEPYTDPNLGQLWPVEPEDASDLLGTLWLTGERASDLLSATLRQVSNIRSTEHTATYQAPPAADLFSEVEAVMRDLLAAKQHADDMTARVAEAGLRLARITRTDTARPAPGAQ